MKIIKRIITAVCICAILFTAVPSALAAGGLLRRGSSGTEVTDLQNRLQELGYFDYSHATGYYGTVTETAVVRFQSNNGLTVDGIAGPQTLGRLYSGTAKKLLLRVGSYGEAVQALQLRLKTLGFFDGTGTGYFGPVTKAAVIAFQKAAGLAVDGIAGPNTRAAAFSGKTYSVSQNASLASTAADIALAQVDKAYVLGGNGPSSFDCSGLAYYALTNAGYNVSRLSAAAYSSVSSWSKITSTSALAKGDLVFFRSDSSANISHMGIYIGDGQFVHASSGQGRVMVSTLSNTYWARNFVFARRVG